MAPRPSHAQDDPATRSGLEIDLNKTEAVEGGCRSYFLFRNDTGTTWDAFELSLAILDRDGVIAQLLTIDAAPLPAGRSALKLFDIPDIACGDIGEIILHDIATCADASGARSDCFEVVRLVSRSGIPLVP
ncbi:hypothetical protein GHC57_04215 [Roseospira navarrensis]|uniref:Uncharacterized protein n=2 Tax=Roseospira navarrensis TaxID=140058 RepID=A0A7X1ZCC7_9PROT|nr:hypothetical protein [Roseospira navarrensis]